MGSTSVMNMMLGWLKSLARWVLGLFDLAGLNAFSPIEWLSQHWMSMLLFLLVAGVVIDLLVWLIRWRPYWVWFRKKRIVIDDDDFFAGEELVDSGLYDPALFETRQNRPRRSTKTPRRAVLIERVDEDGNPVRRAPARKSRPRRKDAADAIFSIRPDSYVDDSYDSEDEVFNVSDLPVSRDEKKFQKKRRAER